MRAMPFSSSSSSLHDSSFVGVNYRSCDVFQVNTSLKSKRISRGLWNIWRHMKTTRNPSNLPLHFSKCWCLCLVLSRVMTHWKCGDNQDLASKNLRLITFFLCSQSLGLVAWEFCIFPLVKNTELSRSHVGDNSKDSLPFIHCLVTISIIRPIVPPPRSSNWSCNSSTLVNLLVPRDPDVN